MAAAGGGALRPPAGRRARAARVVAQGLLADRRADAAERADGHAGAGGHGACHGAGMPGRRYGQCAQSTPSPTLSYWSSSRLHASECSPGLQGSSDWSTFGSHSTPPGGVRALRLPPPPPPLPASTGLSALHAAPSKPWHSRAETHTLMRGVRRAGGRVSWRKRTEARRRASARRWWRARRRRMELRRGGGSRSAQTPGTNETKRTKPNEECP